MLIIFFLAATLADQIAAFVGNDVILQSEISENIGILANDPMAMQMFSSEQEMNEYVVEQLVANKLLLIEAEQESIFVDDDEVVPMVNQNVDNLMSNFPSEADFFKYLEFLQQQLH